MKKLVIVVAILFIAIGLTFGWGSIREVTAQIIDYFYTDADMGPFYNNAKNSMTKEEFMLMRSNQVGMYRGLHKGKPVDPQARPDAIRELERQEEARSRMPDSNFRNFLDLAWTEIGPNPIPNAQVDFAPSTTASGRTTAIAVHPTNADIVYVGTAQGGLYRSTDGGTNWTRMMDSALSLSIGAIAIAPSQPDTVYVGTGEPNFSLDSFFGVGIYRIDNASTGAPILSGPFNKNASNVDIMTGAGVGGIAVHPTDPNTIFVATTFGLGGIGGEFPVTLPPWGLYRSTNAGGGAPTFTKLDIFAGNSPFLNISDVVIDPNNANNVICVTADQFNVAAAAQRGIYQSTNALAATPTWTLRQALNTFDRTELAINHVAGTTTVFAGSGLGAGQVFRSVDGGTTWALRIDNNFCTPQCFYDVAIDVDPTNASNVYIGGAPSLNGLIFSRSTDGGATFPNDSVNTVAGLHVDTHAIAVAPSSPTTVYFGSDGGIYKTTNVAATPIVWTSLNNSQFTATQFMGLDVHPTNPNITIGGTQDNGTNRFQADGTWTRTDFGDGGYSVIDQSSSNTTTFNQYHTYFNATTLTGYAFSSSSTAFQNWTFRGCQGATANGITCATTINFYAPLERGPGTPNTVYYGADRLYRTADTGATHTTVSQTFGTPISAIGIAPSNDNVRVIGQNNGGIFGTTTGVSPLVDMDPGGAIPNDYVGRVAIHPTNSDIAYVTLSAFGVVNVWRTSTLSSLVDNIAPTWAAATGTGANVLPQVPVNAFLIDPLVPNLVYAGTDIGVYVSGDQGTNWFPMGTGLPRVAVFDMAMTSGRLVRIATHGRGMWQIPAAEPTAANVSISGRVVSSNGFSIRNARVTLTGQNGFVRTAQTNSFGYYRLIDIPVGQTYVMDARAKSYSFTPRTLNVNDELTDIDLVASP